MIGDWSELLTASDYSVARLVLTRGVAAIYLIAFVNVRNQFAPLLGERGLLPAPRYLAGRSFGSAPSLFHWRYSDRLVAAVAWAGIALALGALIGLTDAAPLWVGIVWWLVMWFLYLSIVNIGQTFFAFGWESLLLEAGFYVAFLGHGPAAPWPTIIALRWLLFRVEFGAGLIKMRGDPCWRDLTCLDYHHETQPMPSPTSRWFHHLPPLFHKLEVAGNHLTQLAAPFLLFAPQPLAGVGAAAIIITQAYLMLSGNYAWLNAVTLLLGFSAIPDSWFRTLGVGAPAGGEPLPAWFLAATVLMILVVVALSRRPLMNLFSRRQLMNFAFNRYHLVNAYGAFGSVTRQRRELIIEGSDRTDPEEADWHAYEFRAKPGDPHRRPPQVAPYHLRLDWLMWFVPLSASYARGWLEALIERLLEGDPAIRRLLRHDPFDGAPPRLVRGRLVDYRFTRPDEKALTGAWWATSGSHLLFGPVGRREEDR